MEKTIAKPSFKETVAFTTMDLDDVGLKFNAQRIGPMNFYGLRKANYGKGFRMPIMPELVQLVYASLENKNYDTAKNVIKTLRDHWITGDTGILYVHEGMFVQDNPNLENRRISMNQKTLERKLGKHEEKGVAFSDDKTIRFVPYGFKRESQSALELSKNPGVIVLVGGEENAEKLARASEHYKLKPYFWALENVDSPITRVAVLVSDYFFGGGLVVDAYDDGGFGDRCSFGVLKDAENPLKNL